MCGDTATGGFNGDAILFEVRMPFPGELKMDMSGSTGFDVKSISCDGPDGNELAAAADSLTVRNERWNADYSCMAVGGCGIMCSGSYELTISCTSDAPTKSPTKSPVSEDNSERHCVFLCTF